MTETASAGRPGPSGTRTAVPVRRGMAAAALVWEQVWPSLWPALGVAGMFLVLAAADLLPQLPGWLHAALLVALLAAFVAAVGRAVRSWNRPGALRAERRLEQQSGLLHRPLGTLADRLAAGGQDPAAALLWAAHQARAGRAIKGLRIGLPRAGLAARDPWGLRALLLLLLAVALADARGDTWLRLQRALRPTLGLGSPAAAAPSLDAWITPPDYTGLPPILLSHPATAGAPRQVSVPVGSKLLAQVHGGSAPPTLKLDAAATPFAAVDESNYRAEATLTAGQSLTVEQNGSVLGSWPILIVPDKPPTVAFTEAPSANQRFAVKLAYQAADDYGLASAKAVVMLKDHPTGEPMELPLPLSQPSARQVRSARVVDLTAHPWAGLPVVIRLAATDGIGQSGQSVAVVFTLPEREFKNPIARAIIDQRKSLSQSPGDRDVVSEILSDLSLKPGRFNNDFTVFLALRTASRRLVLDKTIQSIGPVQQLLWETALRLEEGQKSSAEQDLRRAQQALQEAIDRNAPDPEIERLMNQLQQAMNNYLQALAQQAQRQPQSQEPIDPSRTISSRDLQRMLDEARRLARSGNREAAQDMLAQLQKMLENLRMAQSGQSGQGSPDQQSMRALQDMMRQQQSLLDRSFRQRQSGQGQNGQGQNGRGQNGQGQEGQGQEGQGQSGQGQNGMGGLARQQDALRRMLDGMRGSGEGQGGPGEGALGRAEQAMRDAAEALGRGDGDGAIAAQSEALNQLGQAARSLADRMRGQSGPQMGGAPGGKGPNAVDRQDQGARDPLGRELPGTANVDNGTVRIPETSEVQKSREILDELRRRSGDLTRPAIEHDYIERLLKRF